MADQPKLSEATTLLLIKGAAVVQTIVMVLLTTDRMGVSLAVPLLGLVLIFGLIPAAAFIKSKK